jgi:hypothetical protein
MECPKCKTQALDVARFCPRCHATLRFECPSCHHEQRHGGTCEKCGVDFVKYLNMILASQRVEADAAHDRLEHRSTLLKDILMVPFNMGVPLIRNLLAGRKARRDE